MDLRYNDIYLKGVAEGKKEAKERWMIKIISYGLKQNWPLEDLAYLVESSVDEVKQVIKDNHLDEKKIKKRERKLPLFFYFFSIFLSF